MISCGDAPGSTSPGAASTRGDRQLLVGAEHDHALSAPASPLRRSKPASPGGTAFRLHRRIAIGEVRHDRQRRQPQQRFGVVWILDRAVEVLEAEGERDAEDQAEKQCAGEVSPDAEKRRRARQRGVLGDADVAGLDRAGYRGLARSRHQVLVELAIGLGLAVQDLVLDTEIVDVENRLALLLDLRVEGVLLLLGREILGFDSGHTLVDLLADACLEARDLPRELDHLRIGRLVDLQLPIMVAPELLQLILQSVVGRIALHVGELVVAALLDQSVVDSAAMRSDCALA